MTPFSAVPQRGGSKTRMVVACDVSFLFAVSVFFWSSSVFLVYGVGALLFAFGSFLAWSVFSRFFCPVSLGLGFLVLRCWFLGRSPSPGEEGAPGGDGFGADHIRPGPGVLTHVRIVVR